MTPKSASSCSTRWSRSRRDSAHELQRIMDVVDGAQPGKQRVAVVLEHVGQPRLLDGLAVEQDLAGIERHQAGDHVDQRALAATVRPEDRDELALRQIEVELVVDDGVVERLAQAANGDDGTPRGHGIPGGRRGREVRAADGDQLSCSSRHGTRPLALAQMRSVDAHEPKSVVLRILSRTAIGDCSTPSFWNTSTSAWYEFRSVSLRSPKPRR